MIHVFLLLVYLGTGDDRKLVSNDMYFRSIVDCNFFASEVVKRFGNYRTYDWMDSRDRATAYCLPKYVQEGAEINLYD